MSDKASSTMSEEHNDETKKRPVNLPDKIMQMCQQISIKQEKCERKCESLLDYVEDKAEEPVYLSAEDPLSIVDKICSSDGTQSPAAKLKLLTYLSEACKDDPKLYDSVGCSPLVYFAENLLSNYSKAVYHRNGVRYLKASDVAELVLRVPMLELLVLSANMSIQKIRAVFTHKSHLLMNIMEAAVQCSYNTARTLNKLQDTVLKKNLVGALFQMEQRRVGELFTNYLGFDIAAVDMKLRGYDATLYEVSDTGELNVNLSVMKSYGTFTGPEASSEPDPILDDCEDVDSAEWSDVVVARVCFLKTLFVYTQEEWRDALTDMSSHVKDILHAVNDILHAVNVRTVCELQVGLVYGFWSSDAEIEGQPLMMVPCLRGQVLSLNGDCAMLWIVDLGFLGFIPKAKLHPLSQELVDLPWLISICLLRGPVCEMDEVFLKTAYKLLCTILKSNAQTGKHMLLSVTGRHILTLIEYPEASIRVAVLKLILCLANNSRDVVSFLKEQQYDRTLLGKLEKYGHAYTANMFTDKKVMGEEIETMLTILLMILEQREDIANWSENRRTSRVMWMYMRDKKCEWRGLTKKCLTVLMPNPRNRQQFHPRFNRNPRNRGTGRHQSENHTYNERGWNSHRGSGQWAGGYRTGTPSDNRNWKSYDADRQTQWSNYNRGRQTNEQYHRAPHFNDIERGQRDGNTQTGGWKKCGDEEATPKRSVETDVNMARRQDRPRLPRLNTLIRPPILPNAVTATYHSLLESCDDAPPPIENTEVKETSEVSLAAEVDYVIYGKTANVKWDKTHELVIGKKLWDIKEVVLAQKLCGLLNNNVEGSMYFGLNKDSTIEGIWLSRGDKDTFRNGIDRIMNRCLIPEVRANSYNIIFTPVLQSEDKLTDIAKQSLFIVEIRVRPLVHMVYMVYQNRKCYTRNGTDTVECTVAQKKQAMMDEEERNLQECMQELEAASNNDLATLCRLIKKYLPDTES